MGRALEYSEPHQSSFTTVPDAIKTRNCTHIPNARAHNRLMDLDSNRASAILYIDRNTHEPKHLAGRTVILCAQSFESLRVLWNSANRQYPNGMGNSSGVLGHYVMDHIARAWATGEFPDFPAKPNINGPNRPCGLSIPDFAMPRFSTSSSKLTTSRTSS